MKLSRPDADIFVPDSGPSAGLAPAAAIARTTHLCVIAHQDDIEINAYPAVAECYGRADRFFTGVVMTNGAGSARTGQYAHVTDAEMQGIRREEQRAAALGRALQALLGQPAQQVRQEHPERQDRQVQMVHRERQVPPVLTELQAQPDQSDREVQARWDLRGPQVLRVCKELQEPVERTA